MREETAYRQGGATGLRCWIREVSDFLGTPGPGSLTVLIAKRWGKLAMWALALETHYPSPASTFSLEVSSWGLTSISWHRKTALVHFYFSYHFLWPLMVTVWLEKGRSRRHSQAGDPRRASLCTSSLWPRPPIEPDRGNGQHWRTGFSRKTLSAGTTSRRHFLGLQTEKDTHRVLDLEETFTD